jgi:DNA repair protein RadB
VWKVLERLVPTGCDSLDRLLAGGFPADGVSLVYGEAETGKTSLAVQCAVNCARMGYRSLFVDSDGTFSSKRLSQIASYDYEKISPFIILMKPTTFQEQIRVIDHLEEYITRKFGLMVVDTITSLYRAELGSPKETFALNRELNRQVALLTQIVKTRKVAALITSQVRNVFLGKQVSVEPVATRVLKFWSDVVLNLELTGQTRVVKVLLEKHVEHKSSASCYVKIEKTGIRDYKH